MPVADPYLSIVIPVYSSERSLPTLVSELVSCLGAQGKPFEIILVNDASPDGAWAVIRQLSQQHPQVRGVDLMFNTGQFRALMCGLSLARGKMIVTMDDDLQHPPAEVPKLVAALEARPDLDALLGVPSIRGHAWHRNLGSTLNDVVFRIALKKPRSLKFSSFRAIRRSAVQAMLAFQTANPVPGPLLFRATRRLENIEVEHHARRHGRSNYSFYRLIKVTMDNLMSYSTLPLKAVSSFGFLSTVVATVLGVFFLVKHLVRPISQPGWTSLVLLNVFFGGVILFSIGFIGEYLIRILLEVNRSPRYVVRDEIP